ncbi:hypothetical protein M9434_006247 [Picochlorum sp. BPE23]|nr:hypothetical protein M9434_006247 [Picochlorum sp. BPE23]
MKKRKEDELPDIIDFGVNIKTTTIRSRGEKKHKEKAPLNIVCNCLSCGKIYDCRVDRRVVENGGVCTFCNSLVPRVAQELFSDMPMPVSDRQDEAYELKDRLVEYDRDSASRTKVIDDQNDYYDILQANAWLSDEERQDMASRMRMLEAEQETSSTMVVTFDVFGRRSAAPCIVVAHDDDEEEEESSSEVEQLLKVAQDRAMEERPYGGGRSVVGPDAALCNANYVMQGRKGQNQSFVEDFFPQTLHIEYK